MYQIHSLKNKVVEMSSNTELIETFNFLNFKKILSIKDMKENTEYIISGAYRTTTKYGDKLVLKLSDSILYLPSRFSTLGDDVVQRLNDGTFTITKSPLREGSTLYRLDLKQILPTDVFYSPYLA